MTLRAMRCCGRLAEEHEPKSMAETPLDDIWPPSQSVGSVRQMVAVGDASAAPNAAASADVEPPAMTMSHETCCMPHDRGSTPARARTQRERRTVGWARREGAMCQIAPRQFPPLGITWRWMCWAAPRSPWAPWPPSLSCCISGWTPRVSRSVPPPTVSAP